MTRFLIRALFAALGLWLAAEIVPGVAFTGWTSLLAAAILLGIVNAVVRPVVFVLTLPLTLVTLGLFLFVVNALMFWAAASLVSGLNVNGFGAALIGSLIYSALQLLIDFVLERLLFKD